MTDFWPHLVLRPTNIVRQPLARTTAGTVSGSGFTQVVASAIAAWEIVYERIVISTTAELRAWDALEAALGGRATSIYVPLIEEGQGTIDGSVEGAVSAGATSIVIERVGDVLAAGYHFTVGDGRLHRIISASPAGDLYTCSIWPPLRADAADEATVEIGMPVCKCRLATDEEMRLNITPGRIAIKDSIRFFEDPN